MTLMSHYGSASLLQKSYSHLFPLICDVVAYCKWRHVQINYKSTITFFEKRCRLVILAQDADIQMCNIFKCSTLKSNRKLVWLERKWNLIGQYWLTFGWNVVDLCNPLRFGRWVYFHLLQWALHPLLCIHTW